MRARLREHADASVIVIADKGATAEVIVDAIDACRRAGAEGIALGVEDAS